MDYTAINFNITPFSEEIADILIATMSSIGYEGFQYTDTGFTAYITCEQFEEERIQKLEILQSLAVDYQIDWNFSVLQDRDWNLEWEKNFTPIVVDNRILIRAGFHPTIPGIDYDIIIEPKMSFGTGHHPTTTLMLETLLDFSGQMKGKRVLDMGCGTGILSILAAKLGASTVTGIDIDEWSYRNARENIENNQLQNIQIKIGNAGLLEKEKEFDFICLGHDALDKADKTMITDYIEATDLLLSGQAHGEKGRNALHGGTGYKYKRVLIWYEPERLV